MNSQTGKGKLIIISAPSGAGKTTLVSTLCEQDPYLTVSISHTTRVKRPDETKEVSYHFIDEQTFKQMIRENQFLEHARVFDHYYGTSSEWVDEHLLAGQDVILEIDWQGAQQVRQARPGTMGIFILPPSFGSLESRLNSRGEDKQTIDRRMRDARIELSHYHEYEYIIINGKLDQALLELQAIITAIRNDSSPEPTNLEGFARELMAQAGDIE